MHKAKVVTTIFLLGVLLIGVVVTIYLVKKQQEGRLHANATPTVIDIDLTSKRPLPQIWQNLAQGGEVPKPQLPQTASLIKELHPQYIRIDHIFDAYELISSTNGQLSFNFSLLDKEVAGITAAGATPFFSLSYVSGDLSGSSADRPDYARWQQAVTQLVSHYSGHQGKNLQNVIYECYNEPDLFGKWSANEYTSLYQSCVSGVQGANNTNSFLIGGPSITSYQQNYLKTFLQFVHDKNIRLDFISWHVYSRDPYQIANDVSTLRDLEKNYPGFENIPVFITEWGSFPEKHLWHDTQYDVSHLVAMVSQSLSFANRLFYFEVKDGVSDTGDEYFGGWGLLTNEKFGLTKKPRYYALAMLNTLKPFEFSHTGDNKNIFAIVSGNSQTDLSILLTNYSYGQNDGVVPTPLRFRGLLPGVYSMQKTTFDGAMKTESPSQFQASDSVSIDLSSDNLVMLEIKRVSATTQTVQGITSDSSDQAARVTTQTSPLVYALSPTDSVSQSSISFNFKTDEALSSITEGTILQAKTNDGSLVTLAFKPQGFGNELLLSVFPSGSPNISFVTMPIPTSTQGAWHLMKVDFDNTSHQMLLTLDTKTVASPLLTAVNFNDTITLGSALSEKPAFDMTFDNLRFDVNGQTQFSDRF